MLIILADSFLYTVDPKLEQVILATKRQCNSPQIETQIGYNPKPNPQVV